MSAAVRGPVLVVDDRHDVLELSRILLEAEGYETTACSYREVTLEGLRKSRPAVMLLDLVPRDEAPWTLLGRIRHDPGTRDIGVVVTSDSPALVERALHDADLRVAAGLVMPFDIEALYAAIAAAARHETVAQAAVLPVPALPLLLRAAAGLRDAGPRVLLSWTQRLSILESFRQHPDLSLAGLQGQGADLIDGVAAALEMHVAGHSDAAAAAAASSAARSHGRQRRVQGLSAMALAGEMALLRREVWRALYDIAREGRPDSDVFSADDLWKLLRRVDAAIDETLCVMLSAWGEAVA